MSKLFRLQEIRDNLHDMLDHHETYVPNKFHVTTPAVFDGASTHEPIPYPGSVSITRWRVAPGSSIGHQTGSYPPSIPGLVDTCRRPLPRDIAPTIAFERSLSQTYADARQKVDRWFSRSKGHVIFVVIFKFAYRQPQGLPETRRQTHQLVPTLAYLSPPSNVARANVIDHLPRVRLC